MWGGGIYWFKNDGSGNFYKTTIDKNFPCVYSIETLDFDHDGDSDVLATSYHDNQIVLFKNSGNENFSKYIIADNFIETHAAYPADIDDDGDYDVVGTSRELNEVAWFQNLGANQFIKHSITTDFYQAHGVSTADFNGDGQIDVVSTARLGLQIAWWENITDQESISTPNQPVGPSSGMVEELLFYETSGSISNLGHSVEYQFEWGDSQYSAWGAETKSHYYDNTGTFQIKARARCQIHTSVISVWSSGLTVSISPNEYTVSGTISYYSNDEPVPDVDIDFTGDVTGSSTSDVDGVYSKDIESGKSFTFKPSKTKAEDVGALDITTYDAALTARHALNLYQLEPNQVIAADVDKNGEIYTFDSALIARYAVGLDPLPSSHVGEWVFLPDSREIQNISANHLVENFTGIILGNVHGGWAPSGSLNKADELFSDNNIIQFVQKDKEITVLFHIDTDDEVISSDIEIEYEPEYFEYLNYELTPLTEDFYVFHNDERGRLRVGLYSTIPLNRNGEFLKLVFLAKEENQIDQYIQINQYLLNNKIVSRDVSGVPIITGNSPIRNYQLDQNYPNPFNSSTLIGFHIPERGHVSLKIFNLFGQEVKTLINGFIFEGVHQVNWEGRNSRGEKVTGGVYFYKLECTNFAYVRKMIILQ